MNIHENARLTPLRREEMALSVIEGALSQAHAARVYSMSAKIVARWVERYKAEGQAESGHDLSLELGLFSDSSNRARFSSYMDGYCHGIHANS